jgi:hypothetical protein
MRTLAWSIFREVDHIVCIYHCGCVWLAGKNWRRGLFLQVEVQWTWSFGAESVYHREGIERDSDQKNFGTKHGITEGMLPTIQ